MVKTCKVCGTTSDTAKWVTANGKPVSRLCAACNSKRCSLNQAAKRVTEEGKQLSNSYSSRRKLAKYHSSTGTKLAMLSANTKYRQTDKGKESKRKSTAKWLLANPDYFNVWRKANSTTCAFYSAVRRTAKLQRTPGWADLPAIKQFYLACPTGKEVDHIIPLQGKLVSGLHVLENLQYLDISANKAKSNRFTIT